MNDKQSPTLDEWASQVGISPYTLTASELEVFKAGLPVGPPPQYIKGEDGLNLAYREWVPNSCNGDGPVSILVPGSSAHSGMYTLFGRYMADRGVIIRIIDTRGHGLSVSMTARDRGSPSIVHRSYIDDGIYHSGRFGDCLDPNQVIRDLLNHVEDLKKLWPRATIHLVGHSSGGGCVSRFVEHIDISKVDSFALLGPYNNWQQPQNIPQTNSRYSYVDMDLLMNEVILKNTPHRYVLAFNLSKYHSDSLSISRWTWNMVQAMAATDADGFWKKYTKPVMFIAAEKDELFNLEECRRQHRRAAAGGPFVVIEDTSHLGLGLSAKVAETLSKWFFDSNPMRDR